MATSLSQRDTRVVNGSISAGIDVFLSYSRRDKTMADRLRDAFAAAKREVWMDVKDILPTEEWPAAIRRGIEAADNFVFLLSPDSVSSDDCRDELNHAIACGKRLIPLLYREAKHNTVPTRLGQIEWIRFDGQVDFEVAFRLLLEAIDTDLVWKHAHTELLQRAAQWQARGRNDAFVLRGSALREAEGWLAHRRDDREPSLSELQTEFIVASQQASRRTLLRLLGGVAVALIVAIALAVLALAQWYRAESERRTAVSRELAVSSNVQREVDPELSVLLATESLGQADTAEAQAALREAVQASHIRATLRGHGSSVNDAVFSPDGKQVATAGEDGTTRLWDASTGQQLRAFSGAGYANTGVAFSANGDRLLITSADGPVVRDLASGQEVAALHDYGVATFGARFSADAGQVLIAQSRGQATVWDPATDAQRHFGQDDVFDVHTAALSPDGQYVLTGSHDGTLHLWDSASRSELVTLRGHTDHVDAAVFSPDGGLVLTASKDGTARVWDASTGRERAVLRGHQDWVLGAALDPQGTRAATSGRDGTVRIWEVATGVELAVLHQRWPVNSVSFSPDGQQLVTSGADGAARLWDVATGRELLALTGHGSDPEGVPTNSDVRHLTAVDFSPDQRLLVTGGSDATARVWDTQTGSTVAMLHGHRSPLTSAHFSPNGQEVLTTSTDGTARLWTIAEGHERIIFTTSGSGGFSNGAFSPDGKLVSAGDSDGKTHVWDTQTGQELTVLDDAQRQSPEQIHAVELGAKFRFVEFGPDSDRLLTTGSDGTATVWSARASSVVTTLRSEHFVIGAARLSPTGTRAVTADSDRAAHIWDLSAAGSAEPLALVGHTDRVEQAAFSPDGRRVVTISMDGTARIWDASSGQPLAVLRGHTDWLNTAAFSPDGRRVATTSLDHTARVWDTESGQQLAVLRGHGSSVNDAIWNADGSLVATIGADSAARLWEVLPDERPRTLRGHVDRVQQAVFSPDGQLVATAGRDGTARVWDASSGQQRALLSGHTQPIWRVAFSPDGRQVATASWDSTAGLWDAATGTALARLTGHAQRVLAVAFSPGGQRLVSAGEDGTARV